LIFYKLFILNLYEKQQPERVFYFVAKDALSGQVFGFYNLA